FTAIKSPSSIPRSIMFAPSFHLKDRKDNGLENSDKPSEEGGTNEGIPKQETGSHASLGGYISKTAELLIATPVDLIFFLLPILPPASKHTPAQKLFQPLDDILDSHDRLSKHLRDILLHNLFRSTVERRMEAICDTVDSGETMFRLSDDKLVQELLSK